MENMERYLAVRAPNLVKQQRHRIGCVCTAFLSLLAQPSAAAHTILLREVLILNPILSASISEVTQESNQSLLESSLLHRCMMVDDTISRCTRPGDEGLLQHVKRFALV